MALCMILRHADEVITDFSAGTNGNALDATTLDASTFGVAGTNWSLSGTNMTYAVAAKAAFGGSIPTQLVNPWPGDVGLVGANVYKDDTSSRSAIFAFPSIATLVCSGGVWFRTDYPNDSMPNIDILIIQGDDGNYVNIPFQGTGSTLRINSEFAGVSGDDKTGVPVAISSNTWYWLTLRYSADVSIPHAIRVYDSSLNQVGNEQSATPTSTGLANRVNIGAPWSAGESGYNLRFSGLLMSYQRSCRWPLLPL